MNDGIMELLTERHIKLTSNRVLILKTMIDFDRAFSLSDLEIELETIDKSTISRTIHLFLDHQLIHSFDDGSGSLKYSVCNRDCNCEIEDLHAHFYCNYCKEAFCLENVSIPNFELPTLIQIESVNLVIKGYCGKCNKSAT